MEALVIHAAEDLRGVFRFHEEFAIAVELLNKGLADAKPLISASLSYRDSYDFFDRLMPPCFDAN